MSKIIGISPSFLPVLKAHCKRVLIFYDIKSGSILRVCYTTQYERDPKNRRDAVAIHGTICQACGFDFEKIYGEIGKDYIEVHHVKPLCEVEGSVEVNAATDLIFVCANCHRMIHRRKDSVLSLKELQKLLLASK